MSDHRTTDPTSQAAQQTLERMRTLVQDPVFPYVGLTDEFMAFINQHGEHPSVASYTPGMAPLLAGMYLVLLQGCVATRQYGQADKVYKQLYHHFTTWAIENPQLSDLQCRELGDYLVRGFVLLLRVLGQQRDRSLVLTTCEQLLIHNKIADMTLDERLVPWQEYGDAWTGLLGASLAPQFAVLPHRLNVTPLAYRILQAWHQQWTQRAPDVNSPDYEIYLLGDMRYHGFANDVDRVHEVWNMLTHRQYPTTDTPSSTVYAEYITALARCGNFVEAERYYQEWIQTHGSPATLEPVCARAIYLAELREIGAAVALYEQGRKDYLADRPKDTVVWQLTKDPLLHRTRFLFVLYHAACYFDHLPRALLGFDVTRARYPELPFDDRYFLTILDALAQLKRDFQNEGGAFDVHDYNEYLISLSYCHQFLPQVLPYHKVTKVYDDMLAANVTPNLETYMILLNNASVSQHRILNERQRADATEVELRRLKGSGLDYATTRVFRPLLLSCIPIQRVADLTSNELLPAPLDQIDRRFYRYKDELEKRNVPLDDATLCVFLWGLAINGDMVALRQQWRGMSIFNVARNASTYFAMLSCLSRRAYWARYALTLVRLDMQRETPPVPITPPLRLALMKCCAYAQDYPTAKALLQDIPLDQSSDHMALYDLYLVCCFGKGGDADEGLRILARLQDQPGFWSFSRYQAVINYHLYLCQNYDAADLVLQETIKYWVEQFPCTPTFLEFLKSVGSDRLQLLDYTTVQREGPEATHITGRSPLPRHYFSSNVAPVQVNFHTAVSTSPKVDLDKVPKNRWGARWMPFPLYRVELSMITTQLTIYTLQERYQPVVESITWLVKVLPPNAQVSFVTRNELAQLGQRLAAIPNHPECWEAALRIMYLLNDRFKIPVSDNVELRMLGGLLKNTYRELPVDEVKTVCVNIDPHSNYLTHFVLNLQNVIPRKSYFNLRTFNELQREATQ
ncbi:hypothetical protein IWQ61_004313 [Dispira simplex]|nr:hypothetical protein IWQ61_004313 [Dispira simplex]